MAHLHLALLGSFQLLLDYQVVENFESHKVRGLLAYLAVEHGRPLPRDVLVDLLWPGQPNAAAHSNFRRALANLRSVIGDHTSNPPYLHITRDTIHFKAESDASVDIIRFLSLVQTRETQPGWPEDLEQALVLYRGPFLEGFNLVDCPEFEQWVISVRSELLQLAVTAIRRLACHHEVQADMEQALALYRRCVALDPFDEVAQRGLMRALVVDGHRGMALTHYEAYRRQLWDELNAEPEPRTIDLIEAIRHGHFGSQS